MIDDKLRKRIENAQRIKCFISSFISVWTSIVWICLFTDKSNIPKERIITITIFTMLFTIFTLAIIFCDMGKKTFELEAKDDPTKG